MGRPAVVEKDQCFVAQRFGQLNASCNPLRTQQDVLGTDAQADFPASRGGRNGLDRQLDVQVFGLKAWRLGAADTARNKIHGRHAEKAGHEQVGWTPVDLQRRTDLLNEPALHDGDAVGHGHGLCLVVGDVDEGRAQLLVQAFELGTHFDPQLGVKTGQRLVQQEHVRVADGRAGQGNALRLATRALGRFLAEQMGYLEDFRRAVDAFVQFGPCNPVHPQTEGNILVHRHVREQRQVLKHHAEMALSGLKVIDHPVPDDHLPAGRQLKPADHVQRGRLATARGADKDHELAVLDFQTDPGNGRDVGTKFLHEIFKHDTGHSVPFPTILDASGLCIIKAHQAGSIGKCAIPLVNQSPLSGRS